MYFTTLFIFSLECMIAIVDLTLYLGNQMYTSEYKGSGCLVTAHQP